MLSFYIFIMSGKKDYFSKKGTASSSTYSKRSSIKNRRPSNRYEMESDAESVGISAKKLKSSKDNYEIKVDDTFSYRIIHFAAVLSAISQAVVCKTYKTDITITK